MVDRDVVLAKAAIIQRCLERIGQVTALDPASLDDIDKQDIFVLNLQRAVQAAIDLGAHILVTQELGMPATLREIFVTLERHALISSPVSAKMQKMCGFRNIAVHDYQTLSKEILKAILTNDLKDLESFYAEALTLLPPGP
ncbi:MAG: DUF86 domain-containing protein [Chloroflexales bacterium]|nr:DUF86 domain-containing protein [Chloroflexales bacterium]